MVLFVLMGVLNHLHMPMVCKVSSKELEKETGNATRENVFDIRSSWGPSSKEATGCPKENEKRRSLVQCCPWKCILTWVAGSVIISSNISSHVLPPQAFRKQESKSFIGQIWSAICKCILVRAYRLHLHADGGSIAHNGEPEIFQKNQINERARLSIFSLLCFFDRLEFVSERFGRRQRDTKTKMRWKWKEEWERWKR